MIKRSVSVRKVVKVLCFPIRILREVGEDWGDLFVFCLTGKSEMRDEYGKLKDKYR